MMTAIRLASTQDAAAIAGIYAPIVAGSATSFELDTPSPDEMSMRIAATLERTPWLVCEADGAVVGYAYASKHRERAAYQWCVEVSAYVHPDTQRRGIAAALYTSLFAVLRLQGYRNAYAAITLPNAASVALHAKLGFARIGVFEKIGYKVGAWHDVLWMQREIAPRDVAPDAPVALPQLLGRPDLAAALTEGTSLLRPRSVDAQR